MNVKKIIFSFLLPFFSLYTAAETVSRRQAETIATLFFNAAKEQVMASPNLVYNGRGLTTNRLFIPFYIFSHPTGGFVVISAENKTYPILGYSLNEHFDSNKLSSALKSLLTQYAIEIERIRYDSSVPTQAIDAWGNIHQYIASILQAPYEGTDVIRPWQEIVDDIAEAPYRADIDNLVSEIYTPQQWEELIDSQLSINKNVELGLISPLNATITPAVIKGKKGNYYSLYLGSVTPGLWKLFSNEILSTGQLALFTNPPQAPWPEDPSDINFSQPKSSITEIIPTSTPIIEWQGSGHFKVDLSEPVVLTRIYNMAGALMQEQTFRDTSTAFLDISNAPNGFYFALLIGESGKPYGIKLYR